MGVLKNSFVFGAVFALLMGMMPFVVYAGHDDDDRPKFCKRPLNFAVRMVGTLEARKDVELPRANVDNVPFIPESDNPGSNRSDCYRSTMLLVGSNKAVGIIDDCLSELKSASSETIDWETGDSSMDDGIPTNDFYINSRVGTTVMNFGRPFGQLMVRSFNDIVPLSIGASSRGVSSALTHWTGSHPRAGDNHVLKTRRGAPKGSTGIFKRTRGTTRLAGGVNLTRLDEDIVFFDCIFQVELKKQKWPRKFVEDVLGQECKPKRKFEHKFKHKSRHRSRH